MPNDNTPNDLATVESTDPRYYGPDGHDEYVYDNEHGNPELVYPNEWAILPGSTVATPVEAEHPDLFYTPDAPLPTVRKSSEWSPRTIAVAGNNQSVLVAGPNPKRCKLTLFTDGANAGAVFITDSRTGSASVGSGSPSIALAANSQPLVFTHTGAVWVFGSLSGLLYSIEESYA